MWSLLFTLLPYHIACLLMTLNKVYYAPTMYKVLFYLLHKAYKNPCPHKAYIALLFILHLLPYPFLSWKAYSKLVVIFFVHIDP